MSRQLRARTQAVNVVPDDDKLTFVGSHFNLKKIPCQTSKGTLLMQIGEEMRQIQAVSSQFFARPTLLSPSQERKWGQLATRKERRGHN